jgi:hypothetical protein
MTTDTTRPAAARRIITEALDAQGNVIARHLGDELPSDGGAVYLDSVASATVWLAEKRAELNAQLARVPDVDLRRDIESAVQEIETAVRFLAGAHAFEMLNALQNGDLWGEVLYAPQQPDLPLPSLG